MPELRQPDPQPTIGASPISGPDAAGSGVRPPVVPGYELGALIGRGGMGDVYRARDIELGRDVAVKILQERYPIDSPTAARFVAEARITGQLQHPGVPAIYRIAALADGRPFLAMKLIKGHTLDELLDAQPKLNHLAIIEAVAQALGYAHAHDVIHRDIKPANVMVGSYGEVQVMDWGLAKVLEPNRQRNGCDADPEATTAATLIRTAPDGSSYTQHGSILGTPAYMSPEQAGGETDRVGTASDVFGLGALWCKLLTGQPPFAGGNAETVRRNAMRGKTEEALARLDQCGGEPEAVALCKQCLAFEPRDRPANGNVVAQHVADMRVAAEERARQAELSRTRAEVQAAELIKRRRMLLTTGSAIGFVLLAGLAVSLWQTQRAMNAKRQAKQNADTAAARTLEAQAERDAKSRALEAQKEARRRAFSALRSLTEDVVERKFAQGAELTEDDKVFLRGVIAQYDAFAALHEDDVESRAFRAEGRFRIGTMRYRLGEVKEAAKDYDESLGNYRQLVNDVPGESDYREFLANCLNNRGLLRSDTGRLADAEKDYDEVIRLRQQLVAHWPDRPEILLQLAKSHNNRGIVRQDLERLPAAEVDYNEAIDMQTKLVSHFPMRAEFRQELAASHLNRGNLRSQFTGRLHEAERDYDAAIRLQKQLATEFPARSDYRQELATSHNNRGALRNAAGRPLEMEKDFIEALNIRRLLAAEFPTQPVIRNDLAGSCVNLAMVHSGRGDWVPAKQFLIESRPHHLAALKAMPENPTFRQFYHNHLRELMTVHAGLLEKSAAVRSAETRRDVGWNAPMDAYQAASGLSWCIAIVTRHKLLDAGQRNEAQQFYADAVMKLLNFAVERGFRDAAQIKSDAALAPLRSRADFQMLIVQIEKLGK